MVAERVTPSLEVGERETLTAFLEFQRATLARKCDGLTDSQLRECAVPPSRLSLLGIVRHMAEVERNWFRRVLGGEDLPGGIYWTDEKPDGDFEIGDDETFADDLAIWQDQIDKARAHAAGKDLEATGIRRGEPCSLRWIYVHMIEEYARHNGHADLIRELIDDAVGY